MTTRIRKLGVMAAALVAFGVLASELGASVGPPRIAVTGYGLRAQLDLSQMIPAPTASVPTGASGSLQTLLMRAPIYTYPPQGRSIKIVWKLLWRLTVSNLTGPITVVRINQGARGDVGPMVTTLCSSCSPLLRGVVDVTAAKAKVLLANGAYVTAATAANSGGEIRGQLIRVRLLPPPAATKP
jgi:hypothetical protein